MKSCISLPELAGDAWVHWCKSGEALLDSWQNGQFHTGMTATDFQAVEENQKSKTIQLTYDKNFPEKSILAYSKLYFFLKKSAISIWQTQKTYPGFLSKGVAGQAHGCWSNHTGQVFQVHISINHCRFNQELQKYTKTLPSIGFKWIAGMNFDIFLLNPMQLKMCDVQFLLTMARALVLSSALHSFSRLSQNQLAVGTATSKDRTFSTKLSILRTCYKRSVHPL